MCVYNILFNIYIGEVDIDLTKAVEKAEEIAKDP